MKKNLLLISMVVAGLSGFAQLDSIKNPNFDAWTANEPNNWGTINNFVSGNAAKATGGDILGPNTIVLTTSAGPTPGMAISNGTITVLGPGSATFSGGFPFRMRPTSLTFVGKYTQGGGSDAPVIQVVLTKWNGTSRDTLGVSRGTVAPSGTYSQQTITLDYDNSPFGGNPTTIINHIGYKAFAPDTAQILLLSSGVTGGFVGSQLFIDSLAFQMECDLDPTILTSGNNPQNIPARGDTITAVGGAGSFFSFSTTSFIPQTVISNLPIAGFPGGLPMNTTVDSIKSTTNELSGSAAAFMTVDANQFNNISGGNSINCTSYSGTIPASPANALYKLTLTPLMWGTPSLASVDRLINFPSPQTVTYYIKVGAGSDTITQMLNDSLHWEEMQFAGQRREYNVYVPTIYDGSIAVPLLFNIHGWTGSSTKQMDFSDFRPIADTANFIVVQPMALGDVPSWNTTTDTTWLNALLDSMEARFNIDTNRIYFTGFSQGAGMSYTYGCDFSERVAAIAPVAGGMSTPCEPTHPMPVMHIHGTGDVLATYPSSGLPTGIKFFADGNGCDPTPVITAVPNITSADSSTAEHWVYGNGNCGAVVEHYKIFNGGHNHPTLNANKKNNYGLNARNNDFEASLKIWEFLSKYRLNELKACSFLPPSTGIDGEESNNTVSIYPNPSNGTFAIETKNYQGAKIQVMDVLGSIVFETELTGATSTIDLGFVAKGVYIYKVTNSTEKIGTGKLIIQ